MCSVDDPSQLDEGYDKLTTDKRRPGALVSNSQNRAPRDAVNLDGPGIEVTGDIQAVGSIKLGPQVSVGGEVRPRPCSRAAWSTCPRPWSSRRSRSPATPASIARSRRAKGCNSTTECSSSTATSTGLSIDGTGAVIVTGATRVTGRGSEERGGSRGDVSLTGEADHRQSFKGLIYTEGDLNSRFLDLAGVFVANSRDTDGYPRRA